MKILAVFIDMLGAEYLNLCNPNRPRNAMDELLLKMGGTLYTQCYSPAPDSPRSSACMWSGLYPKENHCNTRLRWPRYFLNPERDNLFRQLERLGYQVNVFMQPEHVELGLIPLTGREKIYQGSIDRFLTDAVVSEDSFQLIYLPDLHLAMEKALYTWGTFERAVLFVARMLEKIFDCYQAEKEFDYILMFSDHGFILRDEGIHYPHLIEDDRSKTFLYMRKKGDSVLTLDHQLRSNLDVFPTVCEMLGSRPANRIDGLSLFRETGHACVMIEDHSTFSVELGQLIDHWCVVLPDGSHHWLECSGEWEHEHSDLPFDEPFYTGKIIEKMDEYAENHGQYAASERYREQWNRNRERVMLSNGVWVHTEDGVPEHAFGDTARLAGKKVLLYGAGKVGRAYYEQLKAGRCCEIVAWVDVDADSCSHPDMRIQGIERVREGGYDCILIGIYDEKVARGIVNTLSALGVSGDRIVWAKPQMPERFLIDELLDRMNG